MTSTMHNAKGHTTGATTHGPQAGTGAVVTDFHGVSCNRRHKARTRFATYMIFRMYEEPR